MFRLYDRLIDGLGFGSCAVFVAITLGITFDVLGRALFNAPLTWVLDYVQYGLVFVVFLGMPWLTRCEGHIVLDLLVNALPERLARWGQVMTSLAAATICLYIGYWAVLTTADHYARGVETIAIYPIKKHILLGVIALGLIVTGLEFMRAAWRRVVGTTDSISQSGAENRVA